MLVSFCENVGFVVIHSVCSTELGGSSCDPAYQPRCLDRDLILRPNKTSQSKVISFMYSVTIMSPDDESNHVPKRRKVRKGTQSCWECKRRKVRCVSTEDICHNCRRRGTACISQELPDVSIPITPSSAEEGAWVRMAIHPSNLSSIYLTKKPGTNLRSASTYSTPNSSLDLQDRDLSHLLRSTWPTQHELDQILALPIGLSVQYHSEVCNFYNNPASQSLPSTRDMLQLPPIGSHPVLIARKLLLLGNYLQGVVLPSDQASQKHEPWYHNIMFRVMDAAIKVTKNEDLVSSVEGIECIMLEATYQNYVGNLHQAWMAVRRATTIAQVLGLHRGNSSPNLKFLETMKRPLFDSEQTCLQIVRMECYLGLILGLPRSSLEAPPHKPEGLGTCEHLQYSHLIVADRILKRSTPPSLLEIQELDSLLERAAANISPQWWLVPDLSTSNRTGNEIFRDINRLNDQFAHFHLLIRVHLPHLMQRTCERTYDYSKMTALNASRETLIRYVAFRDRNAAAFYCRGTDFICFAAATVLSLGHIECSRLRRTGDVDKAFGLLVHSRPSDRGLLERTLEVVRGTSQGDDDSITRQIVFVLSQLLRIEGRAASGVRYRVWASEDDDGQAAYHSEARGEGELRLYIPAFGKIDFGVEGSAVMVSQEADLLDVDVYGVTVDGEVADGEWDMQGIDLALFEDLFGGSEPNLVD